MHLPGLDRLRLLGRQALAPWRSSILVLLYHRVIELATDPLLLAVTPAHFAEHLAVLGRLDCPVLTLEALGEAHRAGRLPKRAVVITFDDGYHDVATLAQPLLAQTGMPATVFVATAHVGGTSGFWWDELERCLLHAPTLPATLAVPLPGGPLNWPMGTAAALSPEQVRAMGEWHLLRPDDPTPRHTLYRHLLRRLRGLTPAARETVLQALREQAGQSSAGWPSHRLMTHAELQQTAQAGILAIGGHTVNHPQLSLLPAAVQAQEIQEGRAHLQALTGQAISTFAYPFGSRRDYHRHTMALVRQAGFTLACANFPASVWRASNHWALPRLVVRDWDGPTLTAHLDRWFHE